MSAEEQLDRAPFKPGFGPGGVPWPLMCFYLAFLVFFTWYVLEYQLPNYLKLEDAKGAAGAVTAPASQGDG